MNIKSVVLIVPILLVHLSAFPQTSPYRVTDYGAVGDGRTLNTLALQKVIDTCASNGGGTVVVPPGVFLTGTIQLRDNVDLHLDRGAILQGSPNLGDYALNGRTVGLLFTQDAKNVSITGEGTLDGNGDSFMVLDQAKRIDSAGRAWTRQKDMFRKVKEGIGDGPVVPKDRPFQMIIFSDCRNVTVRGVLITNSPFWTLHFADCDGVILTSTRIWCNLLVPNNDGVDFTSCSNVVMSDCDIRTGDDCIVVTGYSHHFNLPGYKDLSHPSENVVVSNCTLVSRSAAIRIGGFDQNPMRNIAFNNIIITNSNRGIGIFARDRGSIENLTFSNIIIETRLHTGDWWGNGEPIHLSAVRLTGDVPLGKIRNVKFDHVICRAEAGMIVYGSDENIIEDVSFSDVTLMISDSRLNDVAGGNIDLRPVMNPALQLFAHDIPGFYARYVKNFQLRDFNLSWATTKQPFFTHGIEIEHFESISIDHFRGTAAPGNPGSYPIALRDGRGYAIDAGKTKVLKERVVE